VTLVAAPRSAPTIPVPIWSEYNSHHTSGSMRPLAPTNRNVARNRVGLTNRPASRGAHHANLRYTGATDTTRRFRFVRIEELVLMESEFEQSRFREQVRPNERPNKTARQITGRECGLVN
jgi:hypothetical protein